MNSASVSSRSRSFLRAAALSRFAPMPNSSILNSTPVTGRTSTPLSARLRSSNNRSSYSSSEVRRWTLDVESWRFSFLFAIRNQCQSGSDQSAIRRVKGAWWPSRSSKPLSIRQPLDRGRFDSYPLRQILSVAAAMSTASSRRHACLYKLIERR